MKEQYKIKDQKVAEVMSASIISLNPKEPISRAVEIFNEYNIHHIPIVIVNEVVGIISQGDVLNFCGKENRLDQVKSFVLGNVKLDDNSTIEEIMTQNPITISPEDSIGKMVEKLLMYRINALPVTVDNKLKGIITTHDILRLINNQ